MSTSTEIVLDTNVCIDLMNAPTTAKPRIPAGSQFVVPIIVVGELLYGAYKSQRPVENLDRINQLFKLSRIANLDRSTAEHFGRVRSQLVPKGRTIPDDDMWIAAITLQLDVPVVTRDGHFRDINNLKVLAW